MIEATLLDIADRLHRGRLAFRGLDVELGGGRPTHLSPGYWDTDAVAYLHLLDQLTRQLRLVTPMDPVSRVWHQELVAAVRADVLQTQRFSADRIGLQELVHACVATVVLCFCHAHAVTDHLMTERLEVARSWLESADSAVRQALPATATEQTTALDTAAELAGAAEQVSSRWGAQAANRCVLLADTIRDAASRCVPRTAGPPTDPLSDLGWVPDGPPAAQWVPELYQQLLEDVAELRGRAVAGEPAGDAFMDRVATAVADRPPAAAFAVIHTELTDLAGELLGLSTSVPARFASGIPLAGRVTRAAFCLPDLDSGGVVLLGPDPLAGHRGARDSLAELVLILAHEAYPGHLLHLALCRDRMPPELAQLRNPVGTEGWATTVEQVLSTTLPGLRKAALDLRVRRTLPAWRTIAAASNGAAAVQTQTVQLLRDWPLLAERVLAHAQFGSSRLNYALGYHLTRQVLADSLAAPAQERGQLLQAYLSVGQVSPLAAGQLASLGTPGRT